MNRDGLPPSWVRATDHPVIVRTSHSTSGGHGFEAGSPHLAGRARDAFLAALRPGISVCEVERAPHSSTKRGRARKAIAPETCTPYVDANAFGYLVKNVLPLVFVRTRRGELLPNARVAIKYMRENASRFGPILGQLADCAANIFDPVVTQREKQRFPYLFSDVAQPYSAFSNDHMAMTVGFYVCTQVGVATVLGPAVNRTSVLKVHTGLMESEWHHSELFLVFDPPAFTTEYLLLAPGTALGQLYFVAKAAHESAELAFSETHLGADPDYRSRSIAVGIDLVERQRPFVLSRMTGVNSLSVSCPHCWVSVTAAAEDGVPDDHVHVQDFYQGYKLLRSEYRSHPPTR